MRDVVLSLIASVIAGTAVWLGQWLLRYRRLARKRSFFGVAAGASSVLVAPRHFSSPQAASVHRRDMAALVELATIVNDCGGSAEYVVLAKAYPPVAPNPVFVVAGQTARANLAAARHLATRYRSLLKKHGMSGRFCLVLKVVEPLAYGADFVAVVADASEDAFAEGPPSGSRLVPDEPERAPEDQHAD